MQHAPYYDMKQDAHHFLNAYELTAYLLPANTEAKFL